MPVKIPDSLQQLNNYADVASVIKEPRLLEDYFQLKRDNANLSTALAQLIGLIEDGEFSPLSGSGSPEGVYAANYSGLYIDISAPALYYNGTNGASTGWVIL